MLRRPRVTTIVVGMYACSQELSLVPAYEICVCEWKGAPCTKSSFIEMAPGPRHMAGPTETPTPPTQADLKVGGHERERELGLRDHVTCYVIARPGHVSKPGRRGGGTHRIIGLVTQASLVERCARSV